MPDHRSYDEVIARMGFTPEGPGEPGGLFHWVATTDDGIRVTDVWQTREIFDKFAAEKIGPITAEVGVPGPPKVTFYEVHNYADHRLRPNGPVRAPEPDRIWIWGRTTGVLDRPQRTCPNRDDCQPIGRRATG